MFIERLLDFFYDFGGNPNGGAWQQSHSKVLTRQDKIDKFKADIMFILKWKR